MSGVARVDGMIEHDGNERIACSPVRAEAISLPIYIPAYIALFFLARYEYMHISTLTTYPNHNRLKILIRGYNRK